MSLTSASSPNLLIVDDDETIQRLLVIAAQDLGWRPVAAASGHEALDILNPAIEAVILDHGLPGINGLQTLARIREVDSTLPVIMLTGFNDAETAVQALRTGADDYLTKPFELKRLFDLLRQAKSNRKETPQVAASIGTKKSVKGTLHSDNPQLRQLLNHLAKAARLDSTILLTGESGTGKTFFAREIHRLSTRANEEFITVSCPALPRELLESELFGHEKGSFTGATASRAGRFEQASKGTIFLDEIGDLPPELQPKLLNVLQDREFFRVGGSKMLQTNARVIAATNVNLRNRVEQGEFREDLYYRLNIIELRIPSLRERREDIAGLTRDILGQIARRRGTEGWQLSPSAIEALRNFDWPGNVRQLENVLERATAFAEKPLLHAEDFINLLEGRRDPAGSPAALGRGLTLQEVERDAFIQTYLRTGKNKAKTARELGISERSVYNLLGRHGLK
ncbi:sigma-54-dependent Fis family transcriptional regulator [Luteolibacter yonseiensis]|uniref:Sigma-54-dependent Fis family transcriptional regulator n=1 Tax=Luteolibacter yonseiensis TaxID=1144680 RepID=A0A934QZW4_9BACT|nr:sigma-54 dependent transcriptional regulator [Luteolibacter yonseiensis]MBK1814154.1 sigma-54-dependent Fis family transcriptional regulator [Luteolibacter yonseiensis]